MWFSPKLVGYTIISLVVALIGYFLLGSAGSIESSGAKVTGGIVIYFVNFFLLLKYDKLFDKNPHEVNQEHSVHNIDTRDEYIYKICQNIVNSNGSVLLVYHSLRKTSVNAEAKLINDAIIERAKNQQNPCNILMVVAMDPQNISGSSELINADKRIEVIFHPSLNVSDLRLSITDRTKVVVGFSVTQKKYKKYKESNDWFESTSSTLTQVLDSYAVSLVNEGVPFKTYLTETIDNMKQSQNIGLPHIRELLDIPSNVLNNAIMPNKKIQPTAKRGG